MVDFLEMAVTQPFSRDGVNVPPGLHKGYRSDRGSVNHAGGRLETFHLDTRTIAPDRPKGDIDVTDLVVSRHICWQESSDDE